MRLSLLAFLTLVLFAIPPLPLSQNTEGIVGVHTAHAQTGNTGGQTQSDGGNTGGNTSGGSLLNPLTSGTSLEGLLTDILGFVVRIGAIVVVLMLVFVGFKFVTARGESGELTKARNMLLWTLIGGLVLLGAQAIALGIQATVTGLGG